MKKQNAWLALAHFFQVVAFGTTGTAFNEMLKPHYHLLHRDPDFYQGFCQRRKAKKMIL